MGKESAGQISIAERKVENSRNQDVPALCWRERCLTKQECIVLLQSRRCEGFPEKQQKDFRSGLKVGVKRDW